MAPPPNNKVGRARVRESVRTAYREAILEAAERVISRDGFTGVKMAGIDRPFDWNTARKA